MISTEERNESGDSKAKPIGGAGSGGWLDLVAALGGGWLPPNGSGEFTPYIFGRMLGVSEETVRNYVKDNAVQVRKLGPTMLISPEAFRAAFPLGTWTTRKVTRRKAK